jgi:hypothetical protein
MTTSRLTLAALAAFSSFCAMAGASARAQTDSPRSRAEVSAEVRAARAAGTPGAYAGEDSGSFRLAARGHAPAATWTATAPVTACPPSQFCASPGTGRRGYEQQLATPAR